MASRATRIRRTNSSAVRLASAASNVMTTAPASSVEANSRMLVGLVGQRTTLVGPEERTRMRFEVQGGGGPSEQRARAAAVPITSRCPRCTPSKLPSATTAPLSARILASRTTTNEGVDFA